MDATSIICFKSIFNEIYLLPYNCRIHEELRHFAVTKLPAGVSFVDEGADENEEDENTGHDEAHGMPVNVPGAGRREAVTIQS